ncbi:hypothetical protein [Brevundimonas nasdae]|uniref:Uncharacterized protein n=1 Tax=Brevundimonas nasdae TaxID=172043 RepID=A0ABX8TEL4_9CAUL|nr:hypothetical protein [Brevundimonas nasdae]QYC09635.1 hypothetical protein KWG56_13730 [Brevundimonas nasdae]QYC15684.1 hypothetical protein KWG63_09055 [Brevundimonas nasdae]
MADLTPLRRDPEGQDVAEGRAAAPSTDDRAPGVPEPQDGRAERASPSSRAYRSRHPVLHRVVLSAAGGLFRPGGRRAGTPTE